MKKRVLVMSDAAWKKLVEAVYNYQDEGYEGEGWASAALCEARNSVDIYREILE